MKDMKEIYLIRRSSREELFCPLSPVTVVWTTICEREILSF